ncbi:MAG: DUF459 domain-containing protein [Syntrophobacteraceae bacterium]
MSISKSKVAALTMIIVVCTIALAPRAVERRQSIPSHLIRPIPKQQYSLLVVGDSLSISLGEQLEQYFAKYSDRIEFQRMGKVSSGLARPDFFDWEQNLQELVSVWHPNIVLIMIGTNDNKPLKRDQRTFSFGSEAWRREYRSRLQRLYEICRSQNPSVRMFWVGAPIMRDSTLAHELRLINRTIESWCRALPACEYVSTWSTLADKDGKFIEFFEDGETGKSVSIRTKDGVHLAPHGSHLLAKTALNAIQKYYSFE